MRVLQERAVWIGLGKVRPRQIRPSCFLTTKSHEKIWYLKPKSNLGTFPLFIVRVGPPSSSKRKVKQLLLTLFSNLDKQIIPGCHGHYLNESGTQGWIHNNKNSSHSEVQRAQLFFLRSISLKIHLSQETLFVLWQCDVRSDKKGGLVRGVVRWAPQRFVVNFWTSLKLVMSCKDS